MAVSREIVDTILNYHPDRQPSNGEKIHVVEVGKDENLVYGHERFQRRAVFVPGQPRILGSFTEQPVLGLKTKEGIKPLAYAADIEALGEDKAVRLADRLVAIKERIAA